MNVNLTLVVIAGVLIACGTYLLTERTLTRILLGVTLAGNGVNLLFLVAGGPAGAVPFVDKVTGKAPAQPADPLPQAMVLTAIVITLAVSAFLLALAYRAWRLTGHDEVPDDVEDSMVVRRALRASRLSANRQLREAALARLAAGQVLSEEYRQAIEDLEDDPNSDDDDEQPGAESEADPEVIDQLCVPIGLDGKPITLSAPLDPGSEPPTSDLAAPTEASGGLGEPGHDGPDGGGADAELVKDPKDRAGSGAEASSKPGGDQPVDQDAPNGDEPTDDGSGKEQR